MHSLPARVESASSKGALNRSTAGPNCWAMARNQPLDDITSDDSRTPPCGFQRAVIQPNLIHRTTSAGTSILANCSHTRKNACISRGLSNGRRCSVVVPEKPPAAPLFAERKFLKNRSSSNLRMQGIRYTFIQMRKKKLIQKHFRPKPLSSKTGFIQ